MYIDSISFITSFFSHQVKLQRPRLNSNAVPTIFELSVTQENSHDPSAMDTVDEQSNVQEFLEHHVPEAIVNTQDHQSDVSSMYSLYYLNILKNDTKFE